MTWQETTNNGLTKSWDFENFDTAWAFASRIALLCAKHDHHPDITVGWGKVRVSGLLTHDAGHTVTQKDWDLAAAIDGIPCA